MKTEYKGIDYGMYKTNRDIENDIRYGVIPFNDVLQAWADRSQPNYIYYCPYCEHEIGDNFPEDGVCLSCEEEMFTEDFDMLDPISFSYEDDGYICEQGYDDTDIFIMQSPYYTYAQLCSPCAPGACYLRNEVEIDPNNKTYCLGHDWFNSNKAPYTVYDVKTNEVVNPV